MSEEDQEEMGAKPISDEERERLIIQEMQIAGVDRATAEFMTSQELGEIDGDLVFIEEGSPILIRIMPDYGPSYAEDQNHTVLDISSYFEGHPKIQLIRDLENQLYALAAQIDDGLTDSNPDFPWEKHDKEAFELAKTLAQVLGETGIPVYYRSHFNNPYAKCNADILVSP